MTLRSFAVGAGLAFSLVATAAFAGPAEDKAAIAKVLGEASAGWSRGDLDAFMASYEKAPQINYVSGGKVTQGYDAIREIYAPRFTEPTKMPKLTTEIVDFDPLGADYAAVVGRFHLTLPDGKDATGLFSLVFHKTVQGWRIVSDHSS